MAANSKRKGKTGELELVRELEKWSIEGFRTVQYQGRGSRGDVEIPDCPWLHVEVKRRGSSLKTIYGWIDQARRDASVSAREPRPVVFARADYKDWLAIMPIEVAAILIWKSIQYDALVRQQLARDEDVPTVWDI